MAMAHEVLAQLSVCKHDITEVEGPCTGNLAVSSLPEACTQLLLVQLNSSPVKKLPGLDTELRKSVLAMIALRGKEHNDREVALTIGNIALNEARRRSLAVRPEERGHVSI